MKYYKNSFVKLKMFFTWRDAQKQLSDDRLAL